MNGYECISSTLATCGLSNFRVKVWGAYMNKVLRKLNIIIKNKKSGKVAFERKRVLKSSQPHEEGLAEFGS